MVYSVRLVKTFRRRAQLQSSTARVPKERATELWLVEALAGIRFYQHEVPKLSMVNRANAHSIWSVIESASGRRRKLTNPNNACGLAVALPLFEVEFVAGPSALGELSTRS